VSGESGEPRDISTRAREAIDYASRDRIHVSHHNNGNRLGRLLGREDRRQSSADKDIDLELHEFGYVFQDLVPLSLNVAILNQDVFPLNITKISQPLPECLDLRPRIVGITKSGHISYPGHF